MRRSNQAELHPEQLSLRPSLAQAVHPAAQAGTQQGVVDGNRQHSVDGAPTPAGQVVAVRLPLEADGFGFDVELPRPERAEFIEVLISVVLDGVVAGLGGDAP
jgi:hypothetical protein